MGEPHGRVARGDTLEDCLLHLGEQDVADLPEAYKVQLFCPPAAWLGQPLRDLELRRRCDVSVLAVKRAHHLRATQDGLPDPLRPLAPGDRLIIVGHTRDLDRLLDACRRPEGGTAGGDR